MKEQKNFNIEVGTTNGNFRYIGIQPSVGPGDGFDLHNLEVDVTGKASSTSTRHMPPTSNGMEYTETGFETSAEIGDQVINMIANSLANRAAEAGHIATVDEDIKPLNLGKRLFSTEN